MRFTSPRFLWTRFTSPRFLWGGSSGLGAGIGDNGLSGVLGDGAGRHDEVNRGFSVDGLSE